MVSKIAVMALVAVVAVPILLGYGLNIQTEQYSVWEPDESTTIDVTDYLYNILDASKRQYTNADLHLFNAKSYTKDTKVYPVYESITSMKTSIRMNQVHTSGTTTPATLADEWVAIVVDGGYDPSNYYIYGLQLADSTVQTFDHVDSFYWNSNGTTATVEIKTLHPTGWATIDNVVAVESVSLGTAPYYTKQWSNSSDPDIPYADVSKGYRLNTEYPVSTSSASNAGITYFEPDGICKNVIFTFNLDSITDPTYWLQIGLPLNGYRDLIEIKKTTTGGVVSWTYHTLGDNEDHPMYYNPDLSSNTYQLYLDRDVGGEFRYIGAWSDTIAAAPTFITYPFTYDLSGYPLSYPPDSLPVFYFKGQTPVMRVDAAQVAAFEYKVIQNVTYTPSEFKANPATQLINLRLAGTSIVFGGNTYQVSQGNITIGTKQFSLRNMVFDSIPATGGYDNRINGITVSNTAQPSQIVFNGDWVVDVDTTAQILNTKEETKWTPGQFAWQGLDDNFLIAGLMTSLAAFVGLAIYGRRSGAKVLPLLLVCGGAAFMFLLMM